MDLENFLAKKLGRKASDEAMNFVLDHPEKVPDLIQAFAAGDPENITMVSMTLGNLARKAPHLLQLHQRRIYEVITFPVHPSVRRGGMRYFSELPILLEAEHQVPKWVKKKDFLYLQSSQLKTGQPAFVIPDLEGPLFDLALEMVRTIDEPTASRVFGVYYAKNLCLKYPELAIELSGTIHEYRQTGTTGFVQMMKKVLTTLNRLVEHYGL
ncbi:MAG: hypothetical protein AAF828_04755 [Bacteroidota bacterium]